MSVCLTNSFLRSSVPLSSNLITNKSHNLHKTAASAQQTPMPSTARIGVFETERDTVYVIWNGRPSSTAIGWRLHH